MLFGSFGYVQSRYTNASSQVSDPCNGGLKLIASSTDDG